MDHLGLDFLPFKLDFYVKNHLNHSEFVLIHSANLGEYILLLTFLITSIKKEKNLKVSKSRKQFMASSILPNK